MANYTVDRINFDNNNYRLKDTVSNYATITQLEEGSVPNTVTQENTTANTNYNILLSTGAVNTSPVTGKVKKNSYLQYNASGNGKLTIGNPADNKAVVISGNLSSNDNSIEITSLTNRYYTTIGDRYLKMRDSGTENTAPAKTGAVSSISIMSSLGYYISNNNTYSNATQGSFLSKSGLQVKNDQDGQVTINPGGLTASQDFAISVGSGEVLTIPNTRLGTFTRFGTIDNVYTPSGSTVTTYGIGMNFDRNNKYKTSLGHTEGGGQLRLVAYDTTTNSDGTPTNTNYIQKMTYLDSNAIFHYQYSAKNTLSYYSQLASGTHPGVLFIGNDTTWGNNLTQGIRLNATVGTIYLRNGSSTSYDISPTKIQKWDSIGTTVGGSVSNTSFPSGTTQTSLGTFSLTAGTWIVMINMRYNGNSTGVRFAKVVLDNNGSPAADAVDNGLVLRTVPAGSSVTYTSMCSYLKPTATTTYHVVATQNSGSTLGVYAYYRCVKVQ